MKTIRVSAIVVSIGILIDVVGIPVSAEPRIPECSKITKIGEQVKFVKAQRDKIAIGDKAHWCPLNKKQINYNEQMIGIFDSDREKCGVRDTVVERLKAATERLRASTQSACGEAPE